MSVLYGSIAKYQCVENTMMTSLTGETQLEINVFCEELDTGVVKWMPDMSQNIGCQGTEQYCFRIQ